MLEGFFFLFNDRRLKKLTKSLRYISDPFKRIFILVLDIASCLVAFFGFIKRKDDEKSNVHITYTYLTFLVLYKPLKNYKTHLKKTI